MGPLLVRQPYGLVYSPSPQSKEFRVVYLGPPSIFPPHNNLVRSARLRDSHPAQGHPSSFVSVQEFEPRCLNLDPRHHLQPSGTPSLSCKLWPLQSPMNLWLIGDSWSLCMPEGIILKHPLPTEKLMSLLVSGLVRMSSLCERWQYIVLITCL